MKKYRGLRALFAILMIALVMRSTYIHSPLMDETKQSTDKYQYRLQINLVNEVHNNLQKISKSVEISESSNSIHFLFSILSALVVAELYHIYQYVIVVDIRSNITRYLLAYFNGSKYKDNLTFA